MIPKNLNVPPSELKAEDLDRIAGEVWVSKDMVQRSLSNVISRSPRYMIVVLRHDDGGCYADFSVKDVGKLGFDSGSPCNDPKVISSYYPVWAGYTEGFPTLVVSHHHYALTEDRRVGSLAAAVVTARKLLKYFLQEEEVPDGSVNTTSAVRRLRSSSGFYLTYLGWDWSMCDNEDDLTVCSHEWAKVEATRRLNEAIRENGDS